MQHFIFNYKRTLNQKILLCTTALLLMWYGYPSLEFLFLYIFDPIEGEQFLFIDWLGLFIVMLSFVPIFFFVMKSGLIADHGELKTSNFIFGKPIQTKAIDLSRIHGVDILKFDYRSKEEDLEGATLGKPEKITDYKVFLLNENHSKRLLICATYNKEEAKAVVDFLSINLEIKRVKYNPPAARRRKMRRRK